MFVKIHRAYRDVIAVCDSDLLGKKFEEEKFQLDVKESFFNGEEKTEAETIALIEDFAKEDAIFNIIGQNSVNSALKAGIINQEGIKEISGIPFALVLM